MTQSQNWHVLHGVGSWSIVTGICVTGFIVSLLSYFTEQKAERERIESTIELRADWRALDFRHKITASFQTVHGVAAWASSRDTIDPEQFAALASASRMANDPVRAVAWAPHVTDAQRAEFEAKTRRDGLADFRIADLGSDRMYRDADRRADYFPFTAFVVFESVVTVAAGFDLAQDVGRRAAIDRAVAGGGPVISLPTATPAFDAPGLTMQLYWPIYSGAAAALDPVARPSALRGVVAGLFRLDALLENAVRDTPDIPELIQFYLADKPGSSARVAVAYFDPASESIKPGAVPAEQIDADSVRITRQFQELGREWILEFAFPPETIDALRSQSPVAWLLAGLMLTGLLALVAVRQRQRTATVEALVRDRTSDLERANEALQGEVSERQAAQAKYRQLANDNQAAIDAAPFAIVALDREGSVITWGRAAEQIFGYTAEEVLGRPYPLVPPGGQEEFERLFQRALAGEPMRDVSVIRRRKDGSTLDVVFAGNRLFDAQGKARGVVYALEDVSLRRRAEAQLAQAQKMEAVGQLTGGMAHDFNNLLAVIIGNLDLLSRRIDRNADAADLVNGAMRGAMRGADLVKRLLAFSRRQPLSPRLIRLSAVVSEVVPLLQRTLGEQIVVETSCGMDVWPVKADPVQLESVILNLAVNARDSMPEGGQLFIDCSNVSIDSSFVPAYPDLAPGDYAVLTVRDSGMGMTPEVQAKAFEPFFTTKPPGVGSGLGLSMVYGYMRQSGGTVKIYSEPGHGTSVRLYLPRVDDGEPAAPPIAPVPIPRAVGDQRILVVEDNPDVIKVSLRILKDLGYHATGAPDAEEALKILESGVTFELLFTDVMMPGSINGLGLAREVRRRFPGLKILFTSGFTSQSRLKTEIDALGADLIAKPYRAEDLAARLREILD